MNRLSQSTYNTLIIRSKKVFKSLILMRSMNVLITARSLTRSKISVNGSGLIIKKRLMNTGSKVVKEVTKHTPPVTPTIPKTPVVPPKPTNSSSTNNDQVMSNKAGRSPSPEKVPDIFKIHQEGQKALKAPTLTETFNQNRPRQSDTFSSQNPLVPLGGGLNHKTQVTSAKDQTGSAEVLFRNYPGQGYTGYDHQKTIIGFTSEGKEIKVSNVRTYNGKEVPQHEATHTNIVDNQTNLAIGINPDFLVLVVIPIAAENFKDQVVQKNGPPKSQQIGLFDAPKDFQTETVVENKEATSFLNKHKLLLDELLTKQPVVSAFNEPEKRINKDSPTLYHENGLPIYDSNGNEIDY